MVPIRPWSAVALAVAALAVGVIGAPNAHAGVVASRYAAPNGSPANGCTQAAPCDLVTAINDATAGADIVLGPGIYYGPDEPLTTPLTNPNPVTLHAATPDQIPVVYTAAATGLSLTAAAISDVALVTTGSTAGLLLNGGSADHIAVFAASGAQGACALSDATLTDSVCAQTGVNDPAIGIAAPDPGTVTNQIRNVTAVSSGTGGDALAASTTDGEDTTTVSNTILDGAAEDIALSSTGAGSITMTVDHSAYRPTATTAAGGTVDSGIGNISAPPQFVDARHNNFTELPSSPTVDAGGKVPVSDVDLANLPRTIGKAADIGAYELPVAPTVRRFSVLKVKRHSVAITVTLNGQGLPTTRDLTATSAVGRPRSSNAAVTTPRPTKILIHGLARHRRYVLRVTATNDGGTTASRPRTVVTK